MIKNNDYYIKRDKILDHLRGFAMIWVIIIHVLYWGNFSNNNYFNLYKSFLLFEMPLLFFITGASNSFKKHTNYLNFIIKRFKRILIPYWIFAFICASFSIIFEVLFNNITLIQSLKIFISWILPINIQYTNIPYLTYALWFIPVYLIISMLIPILKIMKASKFNIIFLLLLIIIFFSTSILNLGWIQNIAFYSIWTYIGLSYKQIKQLIYKKSFFFFQLSLTLIGIILLYIFKLHGFSLNMQLNKFPPNIIFFIFSIVAMNLILLLFTNTQKIYKCLIKNKLIEKTLNIFSINSMSIFLYQVFAFNITIPLTNLIFSASNLFILKILFCIIISLPLCAILGKIFSKFDSNSNINLL